MCLGIPGKVVEIVDPQQQRAIVDVDGVRREISVALLGISGEDNAGIGELELDETVGVGDWVLLHVGFAMSKIDEHEATETLRALKALGGAYDQELDEFSADGPMDPTEMLADELPGTSGLGGELGDPTLLPPTPRSP